MIKCKTECAGWFKLTAVKPDGSSRILADWFPNLITNGGLNRIQANADGASYNYVQVGSGSGTPAVTDTALGSRIAGTNTPLAADVTGAQSSAPYYGWRRKTWRFGQGVAAGNLSEIGVGWATSGSLFSRALILVAGVPTTITVLADEYLDVTYELRAYPNVVDITGTVTVNGINYDWVSRPLAVTNATAWAPSAAMNSANPAVYNGALVAITAANPTGTQISLGAMIAQPYSSDSFTQGLVAVANDTQGNLDGGISAFAMFNPSFRYQIGFTPALPKNNSNSLNLFVSHSWARKTL